MIRIGIVGAGRLDHRDRLDWDIKTLRVGLLAARSAGKGKVVRVSS